MRSPISSLLLILAFSVALGSCSRALAQTTRIPAERSIVQWLGMVENNFPSSPDVREELRAWHRARYSHLYQNTVIAADSVYAYVFTNCPGLQAFAIVNPSLPCLFAIGAEGFPMESVHPLKEWPDSTMNYARVRFVRTR